MALVSRRFQLSVLIFTLALAFWLAGDRRMTVLVACVGALEALWSVVSIDWRSSEHHQRVRSHRR